MPLLRNGNLHVNDVWQQLGDDDEIPRHSASAEGHPPVAVSLSRYLTLASTSAGPYGIGGVRLEPTDDVTELTPFIDRLQLIIIDFPAYTDGRGYSQARTLRSRLGFAGELRAVGDVRADQLHFMMRAGIDTFDLADAIDESVLQGLVRRYQTSYQPSYSLAIAG